MRGPRTLLSSMAQLKLNLTLRMIFMNELNKNGWSVKMIVGDSLSAFTLSLMNLIWV